MRTAGDAPGMRPVQRPPTVGVVAALTYLLAILAPYLLLSDADVRTVALYYDAGVAGPQFLSLLAVVAAVLFAAGRQGRSDPDFVAGLALVLGVVLAALVLLWAVSVPESVILSIGEEEWFAYHRWLVALAAVALAGAAAWYVRALGLV